MSELRAIEPDQFHQIHDHKETIDRLLRSAYSESMTGLRSSDEQANADFRAAIDNSDKFGGIWGERREQTVANSLVGDLRKSSERLIKFQEQLDKLNPDLRQRINDLRFPIAHDYKRYGAQTWNMHADNVQKIKALLPGDMKNMFTQIRKDDLKIESENKALSDLQALKQYPVKSRFLAARELAIQGKVEDSQQMLNEVLRLKPELSQSPQFGLTFENPTILRNYTWDGTSNNQKKSDLPSLLEQLMDELFRRSPQNQQQDNGPEYRA